MKRKTENQRSSAGPVKPVVWIAVIALAAELLALAAANIYLVSLGILPGRLQIMLALFSALIWAVGFLLIGKGKGRGFRCGLVTVCSVLVVAASLAGVLYMRHIYASYSASNATAREVTTVMAVYVRADAGYEELSALRGGMIGVGQDDAEKTGQILSQIQEALGETVQSQSFAEPSEQIQALKDGQVDAIVLNEATVDALETAEGEEPFETWAIKLPLQITVRHEVETLEADVTRENFIVYISGIDNRGGSVNDTGRSDVNILAVVNPTEKKILLVNTPRDYYVGLYGDDTKLDKLTHAGLYGVDCSMDTLGALYGVNINYFVRVNFDSVVRIVDALGGITVTSEYNFYSDKSRYEDVGYNFHVGENELTGDAALAFARSRNFLAGDRVRGQNQQAVIKGVIDKITSPAILTNFNSVLDAILDNTRTNFTTDDINALIRMELEDMAKWDITSISVDGGDRDAGKTYTAGYAYVMIPYEESVQAARDAINAAMGA